MRAYKYLQFLIVLLSFVSATAWANTTITFNIKNSTNMPITIISAPSYSQNLKINSYINSTIQSGQTLSIQATPTANDLIPLPFEFEILSTGQGCIISLFYSNKQLQTGQISLFPKKLLCQIINLSNQDTTSKVDINIQLPQ